MSSSGHHLTFPQYLTCTSQFFKYAHLLLQVPKHCRSIQGIEAFAKRIADIKHIEKYITVQNNTIQAFNQKW